MIFCTKENLKNISIESNAEFDLEVDVVVVGLGTAGSFAAIAAGREGKSVIGIELNTYMGGVGTGGGIHSYCCGTKGGIQEGIDAKCQVLEPLYSEKAFRGFHPDAKKYVLEQEAIKANVGVWYQSIVIGVFMIGNTVLGVQVHCLDGIKNIKAKVVIDCSGEGEVCALANCEFTMGRETDGMPQPYSFPRGYINEKNYVTAANFDAGFVDPTNGEAVSKAVCHSQALHIKDSFDENSRYLYSSSHLGLREGRFILGEDTLSFNDLIHRKNVPNIIFQARAFHDNHTRDWAFESSACQKWVSVCGFWHRPTVADVPYGVIVPKGVNGLLVAGRCVSMDHDSSQTFRMQRDMQKLGEVAGIAASVSIEKNVNLKDVPYFDLRIKLIASGCLSEERIEPPAFETEFEKIKELLSLSKNGEGIWSAYIRFDEMKALLHKWVLSKDEHLRKNTAFVLAMKNDEMAIPVLMEMVKEKDSYMFPNTARAQERQWSAIFLLGELKVQRSANLLLECITNKTVDFQTFTQSLVALTKIGEDNTALQKQILKAYEKRFADANFFYDLELQLTPGTTLVLENYTNYLRIYAASVLKKWGFEADFIKEIPIETLSDRDKFFYKKSFAS